MGAFKAVHWPGDACAADPGRLALFTLTTHQIRSYALPDSESSLVLLGSQKLPDDFHPGSLHIPSPLLPLTTPSSPLHVLAPGHRGKA